MRISVLARPPAAVARTNHTADAAPSQLRFVRAPPRRVTVFDNQLPGQRLFEFAARYASDQEDSVLTVSLTRECSIYPVRG